MPDAIQSSLILYGIWTLLPLVVAVVIFKLFPDTQVTVSGPMQNLTINATGAFAAYLATLVAGWFLIDRIDSRIQQSLVSPTWELNAKVKFVDTEGREINANPVLRKELRVDVVDPPLAKTHGLPRVYVRLPLVKPDEWPTLQFTAPGFIPEAFSPRQSLDGKTAKVDKGNQRIEFSEEVVLRQAPRPPEGTPPPKTTAEKYMPPTSEGPAPVVTPSLGGSPGQ